MDEYTYTKCTLKQEEERTWSVFSLLSIKFDGEPFQIDNKYSSSAKGDDFMEQLGH
jgi:hypothetical protein